MVIIQPGQNNINRQISVRLFSIISGYWSCL